MQTDSKGHFQLEPVWRSSLLGGLLPHEPSVEQQICSMSESYIPGVGDAGWLAFERTGGGVGNAQVLTWLDRVADGSGPILPFGARALQMIGKALAWLLKQVRGVLIGSVGLTLTAGMTALDPLAWLLTLEMSRYVGGIIAAIFRFLGRVVMTRAELTVQFVRWVLGMLFGTLSRLAGSTLSRVG